MTVLVWGTYDSKTIQTGLDRGVLYTPSKAVVWNGLVSADINSNKSEIANLYYNGEKTFDYVMPTTFSGKITAITYPDELLPFIGYSAYYDGTFIGQQPMGIFGLSYRTLINDASGDTTAYKMHLLYNLSAIPDSNSAITTNDSASLSVFSWSVTSIPVSVPGFRPTSHFSLDSRKVSAAKLTAVENALYGTTMTAPYLPTITELLTLLA